MNVYNNISYKIIYNYLNLDYPNGLISYSDQTNKTICKIMNDFINIYKNDFNFKTFILVSQDDIYSLIAYNILKNIQGMYKFNLKIIGKRKNTKEFIKKNNFINKFKLKKIKQDNIIYISCFNPIYKVKNNKNTFKELRANNYYNIIDKFTPLQFQIISEFYAIKNEKLLQEFKQNYFLDFKWFTLHDGTFENNAGIDIFNNEYFYDIIKNKFNQINTYIIKLNGNENDFILFDSLIKTDGIFLYFFDNKNIDFLKENLNFYISPKNAIKNYNSNNYLLAKSFHKFNMNITYLGNWTEEEKDIWRRLK